MDGEEVPYADVAKGYELPDGEMVVLTDEDLAHLPLPTARSIEVLNFSPADQVDPILWNRSYYVEPETAGTRAYVLLRDALERSGKVAVTKVALRQRESLATLRARTACWCWRRCCGRTRCAPRTSRSWTRTSTSGRRSCGWRPR